MKQGNAAQRRTDRLIREHNHDPYKMPSKLPDPAVCPECRAVFHQGRWRWAESWPCKTQEHLCQACRRIKDHHPAGMVQLGGGFVRQHKDDILRLIRHLGEEEEKAHPLHRIMGIEEGTEGLVVRTTDVHLPHRIGHALHDAFKGKLEYHYEDETCFIRVNWRREDQQSELMETPMPTANVKARSASRNWSSCRSQKPF